MPKAGFSVVEVVVALAVLVIGTGAVAALVSGIMAKSNSPNLAEQANYFAAERVNYFRGLTDQVNADSGSVNGFVAAGGSYYPPPTGPGQPDLNTNPNYHNLIIKGLPANKVPTLFVREYLYEATESKDHDLSQLLGQRNQQRRFIPGQRFARNEIPPTPARTPAGKSVFLVVPNDEKLPVSAPPVDLGNGTFSIPAARANDDLRGVGFPMNDRSLRFVREVWVQLNHPEFDPGALVPGIPAFLIAPPYTAVVTVRVYPKEPRLVTYDPVTTASAGVGYYSNKPPLAEMIGYFGLQ